MDIEKITDGRFLPAITNEGMPVAFSIANDRFTIAREKGSSQVIDCTTGLGATAICSQDGVIIGYGGLDLADLDVFSNAADDQYGATAGKPLARLASHGLHFIMPLDLILTQMPPEFVKGMLSGKVEADFVTSSSLTDEMIEELQENVTQHQHAPGETCRECHAGSDPLDEIRNQVEEIVSRSGHAVILVTPGEDMPGHVYTVGLGDVGWPEIVLTGLYTDQGRATVNLVIDWLRRQDLRPADGMIVQDAVNIPLRFQGIDRADAYRFAKVAAERHIRKKRPHREFKIIQLMWPDRNGIFPDHDQYDGTDLPEQVVL